MFKHIIQAEQDGGIELFYSVQEILTDPLKYRPDCSYLTSVGKPQLIAEGIRECQYQLLQLNVSQMAIGRKTNFKIVGYEIIYGPTPSEEENTFMYFVCQDFNAAQINSILL